MTRILVINASPNAETSVSRYLTERFIEDWRKGYSEIEVVYRDVGLTPPPHLDQATINAYYTPADALTEEQQDVLALSNAIVSEVEAADIVLIGSPMHNFGISSGLKTWLDHLARVGRTFRYTENGPEGLLGGRKVFVLTARGGAYNGTELDIQEPYLRTVLGFVGLSDITFIHAEGLAAGSDGKAVAEQRINDVVSAIGPVAA